MTGPPRAEGYDPGMFGQAIDYTKDLIERGGPVMWPLAILSVVGLMLIFERTWFWVWTNNPVRLRRYQEVGRMLRQGQADQALRMVAQDASVYGRVVHQLLRDGATEPVAVEAIELQRPRFERFMATLGTIITAAPMLGILGTVMGIMMASGELGQEADPKRIFMAIGVALITTMAGLVVALVVLLPYNLFKAQMDRTLGRLDALIAAAEHGREQGAGKAG